jgi:hypothetical protein
MARSLLAGFVTVSFKLRTVFHGAAAAEFSVFWFRILDNLFTFPFKTLIISA